MKKYEWILMAKLFAVTFAITLPAMMAVEALRKPSLECAAKPSSIGDLK